MILTVALWLVVTVAHVALTARAVHRVWPPESTTLDERLFVTAAAIVGSLSIVLHATALTTGIGLASATIALAIWHAAIAGLVGRRVVPSARFPTAARTPFTIAERVAAAVLTAIVLTWIGLAASSADVLGPDAAHYHVPYAVNFAAGASPFSLPATPHLYPVAASVIGAWFILPTGDPLIVDLAMTLPFALLIVSINVLFRCTTGRSGLAWASWLGLALFATPMFRTASQGSADLWFAASFVALIATIVRATAVGRWTAPDVVLAAAMTGLLLGSKTTGAPASVLILGAAAVMAVARRVAGGPRVQWPTRLFAVLAVAMLVCTGAGAIWLVRSWVQFGSPFAPAGLSLAGYTIFPGETFQQTTYLSVLGEMQTDSFRLLPRVEFFVDRWFGSWYLPALSPLVILVIDLVRSARQRRTDATWWTRLELMVISLSTGGILIYLLIGAPWTALERSGGLTLRYVLPLAALLPVLALIGCFPLNRGWYSRVMPRAIVATGLVVGATWLWWRALAYPDPAQPAAFAPGISLIWVIVAGALMAMLGTRAGRWMATMVVVLIAAGWWAPMIVRADRAVRAAAWSRLGAEQAAFLAGTPSTDPWRRIYLALRASEPADAPACPHRRYFALTRFDEPLALQPPSFGSEVFYAGRDIESARLAGPLGPCDFIVTTPGLQQTDKGPALADALAGGAPLAEVARTAELVVLKAGTIRR